MSGENNPHFNPFDDVNPVAQRTTDNLTPEAAYVRDYPQLLAMFDESTNATLADLKRFNDAVEAIVRWSKPKR